MTARLEVIRDGDTFIDRINFTLFKCNLFASYAAGQEDCSLCNIVDKKYECVWCGSTCSYVDACLIERPSASCPPPSAGIQPIYPPGHDKSLDGSLLGNREENEDDERDARTISNQIQTKTTQLSFPVICLVSAAAVGLFFIILLITVTTVKRKGSGSSASSAGSSSLSSGHHHLFSSSDAVLGTKIPHLHSTQHPLISNCKPLPLVPLIDRESSLYDKVNPCSGPPTTQPPPPPTQILLQNQRPISGESSVNAIYSEINEYNESEEEDARVLISSSSVGPQLIHLHPGRTQMTRQSSPTSSTKTTLRPINYPQFITFNTIGRNSQRNGYPFPQQQHPQTTTAITVASSLTNNPVSASNGVNTYAVYAYEKFAQNLRGSRDKITFNSGGSSVNCRDRFV